MQNGIVLGVLTATTSWVVTEFYIDKNWKLKEWNEKMWKLEGQFCIFAYKKFPWDKFNGFDYSEC